jgi:hypothetical protein
MRRSPCDAAALTHRFVLWVMPIAPDCSRASFKGNPLNEIGLPATLTNGRRVFMTTRLVTPGRSESASGMVNLPAPRVRSIPLSMGWSSSRSSVTSSWSSTRISRLRVTPRTQPIVHEDRVRS